MIRHWVLVEEACWVLLRWHSNRSHFFLRHRFLMSISHTCTRVPGPDTRLFCVCGSQPRWCSDAHVFLLSLLRLLDPLLKKIPSFQYLFWNKHTQVLQKLRLSNFTLPNWWCDECLTCFWVTSFSHSVLSTTLACSTCLALDHWLCSRRSASSEVTPSRSVILDTAWDGKQREAVGLDQGLSKSGTVDLPSDKAWKKMIIIMLFVCTDTYQLSENGLLFFVWLNFKLQEKHKKRFARRHLLVYDSGIEGETVKFPQTISLN